MTDELATWDATETAARIAAGDVSATEVLEAAVTRAESVRDLGAVVTETFDAAVAAADRIAGPFAGVPTFIKDLSNLAGVPTGFGTDAIAGYVPAESDPFVDLVTASGLVPLGKSATPEFGLTATTEPVGRTPTRNPHDRSRSVGGSSGGSAALVAAGVVPIATASDGGGSIRIPAAACGVVGLKPSRGRYPSVQGDKLPLNILTSGVITRSVRDQVGFHAAAEDRLGSRRLPAIGSVEPPARPLRIAVSAETPVAAVDPAVLAVHAATARLLEDLGHEVDVVGPVADERFADEFLDYWAYLAFLIRTTSKMTIGWRFDGGRLEPWTRGLVRRFARHSGRFMGTVQSLRSYESRYVAALRRFDVLVTPVTATPPPPIGYLAPDLPFETHLERVLGFASFAAPWNVSGAPALALPMGRTDGGLPIGMQVGGLPGMDGVLLGLGLQIEEAVGGFGLALPDQ